MHLVNAPPAAAHIPDTYLPPETTLKHSLIETTRPLSTIPDKHSKVNRRGRPNQTLCQPGNTKWLP